jgi:hypothetical protein
MGRLVGLWGSNSRLKSRRGITATVLMLSTPPHPPRRVRPNKALLSVHGPGGIPRGTFAGGCARLEVSANAGVEEDSDLGEAVMPHGHKDRAQIWRPRARCGEAIAPGRQDKTKPAVGGAAEAPEEIPPVRRIDGYPRLVGASAWVTDSLHRAGRADQHAAGDARVDRSGDGCGGGASTRRQSQRRQEERPSDAGHGTHSVDHKREAGRAG